MWMPVEFQEVSKEKNMNSSRLTGVAALLVMMGCATTYETETLKVFVDRKSLEDVPDNEISAQNIDLKAMKKQKKLQIGVRIKAIRDESVGSGKIPNFPEIKASAKSLVENYLARVKAYRVVPLASGVSDSQLMSGDDIDGVAYSFYVDMDIKLNSETEERYDYDETMYKASIDWQLIDNRTKKNGLGDAEAPFIKESLTCKNVDSRKTAISSSSGKRMGGSAQSNAQNVFRNVLENSLIEFRAQLANRIPFGGRINSFRNRDGNIRFTMKAGPDEGITKRMQMLVVNVEGDPVAIGQVIGGIEGNSNIEVWRWMSPSLKKEILAVVDKGKKAVEDWMEEDENDLFAVCLGMPTPDKDERTQIKDFER